VEPLTGTPPRLEPAPESRDLELSWVSWGTAMSVRPAPEIPNLVGREGLVVVVVVIVVLHARLPVVGCRRALVRSVVR